MPDLPTTNINPEYTKEGFGANSDQTHIVSDTNGVQGMLDQTLAQVLQTNPQAQQQIIQKMGITLEQFEQMRSQSQGSQMMQMTLRELLEKGIPQQGAVGQDTMSQVSSQFGGWIEKIKGLFR